MKSTIYCLLTLQMLHNKFGKVVEKKMLTDDDGHEPTEKVHQRYSGDHKCKNLRKRVASSLFANFILHYLKLFGIYTLLFSLIQVKFGHTKE